MFVLVHVSLKQFTCWLPARREGKPSFSSETKAQMRESEPVLRHRAASLSALLLSSLLLLATSRDFLFAFLLLKQTQLQRLTF